MKSLITNAIRDTLDGEFIYARQIRREIGHDIQVSKIYQQINHEVYRLVERLERESVIE